MIADLRKLNLTGNPFEDFELLDETLSRTKLDEHAQLFKDREKIAQLLLFGVTSSSSYKVVLHGEAGVGKSSLLNKVLHDLRQAGYFGIKYRVNVVSAEDVNLFERELLRTFGEEIVREARRSHGFLEHLRSIVQLEKRNDLRHFSVLALLYSCGQVTVREGKVDAKGLSATVGLPFLQAQVSEQEQNQIEVTTVGIPSHLTFEQLLRDGVSLLKELDYKGVVIAIDEIDKLEKKLEARIVTLVKDTFYPTGLCHVILVMKDQNERQPIHPDVFTYESVYPLPKRNVTEFLEELYKGKAFDRYKPLTSIIDQKLLNEICEENKGIIRRILKDLRACVLRALISGKTFIDRQVYEETKASDELQAYLLSLKPNEVEYKILLYLSERGETYARDKDLSKLTEREKSALSQRLHELETRGLLISKKRRKNRIFSIDPILHGRVKSVIV
jgi:hypothetical protein